MSKLSVDIFNIENKNEHNQEKIGYVSLYKEPKKAIIEGGKVTFEGNKELDREIEISESFATSHRIKEIKFCNFIPHDPPSELKQCCLSLEQNLRIVFEKNNEIDFSYSNTKRLHEILDFYSDLSTSEREGRIFKYDAEMCNMLGVSSQTMRIYLQIKNIPNEKTVYKYIFCDPYHLAISATHNGNSPEQMIEINYKEHSGHSRDIRDLFKEIYF